MDSKVRASIFWFLARLFVGFVLAAAGFLKLIEPVENVTAILAAYPVISDNAAFVLASVLPWAELIFGSFLILGYALPYSAIGAGFLIAGFLTVLSVSRFFYGFSLEDCGCFGGGFIRLSTDQTLVLDLVSFVLVIRLAFIKSWLLTVDRHVYKTQLRKE